MNFAYLRLLTVCTIIVLATSSCSKDPNVLSPETLAATRETMKSLQKLKAATDVGVNKSQYGSLVIDAQAAVNQVSPKLPEGELKKEIKAAIECYVDANTGWSAAGADELMPLKGIIANPTAVNLKQKYNIESFGLRPNQPIKGELETIHREAMLSTIWKKADEHVERAESLMPK